MPEMMPVASSMFDSVGHDPETNTLHVKMKNGKVYTHADFSAEDYDKFVNAESMGRHYGTHIRGRFTHAIVEPEETTQSER